MVKAEDWIVKKYEGPKSFTAIQGYDFSQPFNLQEFLLRLGTTGFQASNLKEAITIFKEMRKQKARIFLGYTSNLVSSGVRDIIAFLVKKKMVDVLVTTTGGVEEDLIKAKKPFMLGKFEEKGEDLLKKGIARVGNVYIPTDRYCWFEDFLNPILEELYQQQKKDGLILTPSRLIDEMGKRIHEESSIYHWAAKHKIPTFCPAIVDGSIGDIIYVFKNKHPDFVLDVSEDMVKHNELAVTATKTGIILLGAGLIKHHICNAQIFRNGADYAIYINSNLEFDGSDSGARIEEAITWRKINEKAPSVKVYGDATIIFPLIVAGVLDGK